MYGKNRIIPLKTGTSSPGRAVRGDHRPISDKVVIYSFSRCFFGPRRPPAAVNRPAAEPSGQIGPPDTFGGPKYITGLPKFASGGRKPAPPVLRPHHTGPSPSEKPQLRTAHLPPYFQTVTTPALPPRPIKSLRRLGNVRDFSLLCK